VNQPKQPQYHRVMVFGCHSTTGPPTCIASWDVSKESNSNFIQVYNIVEHELQHIQ
jgi:hypothetical protein